LIQEIYIKNRRKDIRSHWILIGYTLEGEDRNYNYYHRTQEHKVKEPLTKLSNDKTVGPNNIHIEVWKSLRDRGIREIYKSANYRRIKLMSYTMKLREQVIGRKLRKETRVSDNQFDFMSGRSTMKAIYLLRHMWWNDIGSIKRLALSFHLFG
jgi:hypothetical protein